jgi:hypothetical protein
VLSGVSQTFQLWNPADLGYAGVMFASLIARGQLKPEVGNTVKIGRLGDMTIEAENNTFLNNLLVSTNRTLKNTQRSSDLSVTRLLFDAVATMVGKRPSSCCGQRGVSRSQPDRSSGAARPNGGAGLRL